VEENELLLELDELEEVEGEEEYELWLDKEEGELLLLLDEEDELVLELDELDAEEDEPLLELEE